MKNWKKITKILYWIWGIALVFFLALEIVRPELSKGLEMILAIIANVLFVSFGVWALIHLIIDDE